jgi:hypothetical protein
MSKILIYRGRGGYLNAHGLGDRVVESESEDIKGESGKKTNIKNVQVQMSFPGPYFSFLKNMFPLGPSSVFTIQIVKKEFSVLSEEGPFIQTYHIYFHICPSTSEMETEGSDLLFPTPRLAFSLSLSVNLAERKHSEIRR